MYSNKIASNRRVYGSDRGNNPEVTRELSWYWTISRVIVLTDDNGSLCIDSDAIMFTKVSICLLSNNYRATSLKQAYLLKIHQARWNTIIHDI